MKKFLYLIFMCIFFSACAVSPTPKDIKTTIPQENLDTITSTEIESANNISSETDNIIALTIENYQQYLNFIANTEIPTDFVTYEELAFMGEFKGLVVTSFYSNKFIRYHYTFVDDFGVEIYLSIRTDYNSESDLTTKNYILQPPQNLRSIESKDKKWLLLGDMEYLYLQGELSQIYWYSNQTRVIISCASTFSQYPATQSSTFMSQLLNIDTATNASNMFTQAIAPALQAK